VVSHDGSEWEVVQAVGPGVYAHEKDHPGGTTLLKWNEIANSGRCDRARLAGRGLVSAATAAAAVLTPDLPLLVSTMVPTERCSLVRFCVLTLGVFDSLLVERDWT
jgi:hypothetical protein